MTVWAPRRLGLVWGLFVASCLCLCVIAGRAQESPVTIQFEIVKRPSAQNVSKASAKDAANIVAWLMPLGRSSTAPLPSSTVRKPQLVQRNKSFEPHVLVVQTGTEVAFPNKDPFFHNVFSLFNGKRFDLGLYEAGSSKTLRFERPGVSFLFCNIHEEMSAVIVAVDTPYFGLSDRTGRVAIESIPNGRYQLHVWYERSLPADLQALERPVDVSDSTRSVEMIRVPENPQFSLVHKNKYGQDYIPPASGSYNN